MLGWSMQHMHRNKSKAPARCSEQGMSQYMVRQGLFYGLLAGGATTLFTSPAGAGSIAAGIRAFKIGMTTGMGKAMQDNHRTCPRKR